MRSLQTGTNASDDRMPGNQIKDASAASLRTAINLLISLLLVAAMSIETRSEPLTVLELKKLMDTSPIRFSLGRVQYQMPKNYLVGMSNWNGGEQLSVEIKVAYPGFLPFSDGTKACFLNRERCRTIQFGILPEGVHSSKVAFESAANSSKAPLLRRQDGYEYFSRGPKTARLDYYHKSLADREFYFWCNSDSVVGDRIVYGSCLVSTRTRAGTIIRYRFSREHIQDADVVDSGLRNLVDSFVVGEK